MTNPAGGEKRGHLAAGREQGSAFLPLQAIISLPCVLELSVELSFVAAMVAGLGKHYFCFLQFVGICLLFELLKRQSAWAFLPLKPLQYKTARGIILQPLTAKGGRVAGGIMLLPFNFGNTSGGAKQKSQIYSYSNCQPWH